MGTPSDETATGHDPVDHDHDRAYDAWLAALGRRLAAARGPLFTTDADVPDGLAPDAPKGARRGALYAAFVEHLAPALRPIYTCSACRRFVRRYGGLVTIDAEGRTTPLLWDPGDGGAVFGPALKAMADRVRSARVTGAFVHGEPVWGTPEAGGWLHLGGPVDASLVFAHGAKNSGQRMAEISHDYETLDRALGDFDRQHVAVALRLLESDQLYRSEKVLGVATWLDGLMGSLPGGKKKARKKAGGKKTRRRDNLVWRAAATAPPGFCHVRTTMIGTLLSDIAAGKDYAEVSRAFAAKMHPLRYLRPQAAPKAGNIKQAEAIIETLGSAGALKRRFARLDDLELLWRSAGADPEPLAESLGAPPGGLFDHLKPKGAGSPALEGLPSTAITWVKFRRTVLPRAGRIEVKVPDRGGFYAFVTAAEPESPPIIQWDHPDHRNPVTWYTYTDPKPAGDWGLRPGWTRVTGVCLFPQMWGESEDRFPHHGAGALFVIDGCVAPAGGGSGLFPSFLRNEYRAVRATLEAFSNAAEMSGRDAAGACGLTVRPGQSTTLAVRVHPADDAPGGPMDYVIDRWD